MKNFTWFKILTTSALLCTMAACNQTAPPSKSSVSFSCVDKKGTPTTVAQSSRGEVPIILWTSDFGREKGYTPLKRCQEVSASFQQYNQQGILNYITTGKKNNLDIICVSSELGGGCLQDDSQGQLWTLRPEDKASDVISKIFDLRYLASAPLEQGSGGILIEKNSRIYLDVNKHLAQAPITP